MAVVEGFELKIGGLQEAVRGFSDLERNLGNVTAELKELSTQQNSINAQLKSNAKAQQVLNESYQGAARNSKLYKEQLATLLKEEQDLTSQTGKLQVKSIELRQTRQQLTLATRNSIKAEKAEAGSINELAARHSLLVQRIRNTNLSTAAGRKEADKYTKEAKELSDQLKKLESAYGSNARNVGNYNSALSGLGLNFKNIGSQLLSSLGIVGGISLFGQALKKSVAILKDFESSSARLQSITRATDAQLKQLTDTAKELGETTFFTASEVVSLQTELAKLGFTTDEIIAAQSAILNLSLITGQDLASSAELAGSTVRAFNLDASETGRVVDVMAKSFSSSALDFTKFSNAISQVAPVAATFGFSIEETTALLGQLANAGFSGEQAGTALRNILLNLADANGKLAKELGGNVKSFDELIPALIELREGGTDLNETLELTDRRSVAAFNQFLRAAEGANELRDSLNGASGSALEASKIMGDTLEGDLKALQSRLEALVLQEGGGINDLLRGITQDITELVDGIKGLLAALPDINTESKAFVILSNSIKQAIAPLKVIIDVIGLFGDNLDEVDIEWFNSEVQQAVPTLEELNQQMQDLAKNSLVLLPKVTGLGEAVDKAVISFSSLNEKIKTLRNEQNELDLSTDEGIKKYISFSAEIKNTEGQINLLRAQLGLLGKDVTVLAEKDLAILEDEFLNSFARLNAILDKEAQDIKDNFVEPLLGGYGDEAGKDDPNDFNSSILGRAFGLTDDQIEQLQVRTQFAQETVAAGISAITQLTQAAAERRTKILDEQLASGIISEEQYAKKREALERQAFKRQKAFSIIQAGINTALAITQTLAVSNIDPLGINRSIQVAITAALGAAQIAAIAAQKFAKGGLVPFKEGGMITGPSHAQGGVKFAAGGRLMEAEGGELILNRTQQARLGGASTFKAIGVPGFADGGLLPMSENVSASVAGAATVASSISDQQIKVKNVVTDTTEQQLEVENIQTNFRIR